jgi:hypothetical protein
MNSSPRCRRRGNAGLRVEVVELALKDRDDVPGDVLVDLGVVQRAAAPDAGLLLRDVAG